MAEIKFDRTPYQVVYYKEGQKHTIRRTPPPKLHDMNSGDNVTITRKKNDDWDSGDKVKIVGINQRQPNTLRVEKPGGEYTFLSYDDVFSEKALQNSKEPRDAEGRVIDTSYLLWP